MTAAMRIRQARQARGWTQRKLALRAGVPQSTVGRIEAGIVDPRVSTIQRILRACGEEWDVRAGEGIDRTQMWQLFRLTPRERLETIATAAVNVEPLRGRLRKRR